MAKKPDPKPPMMAVFGLKLPAHMREAVQREAARQTLASGSIVSASSIVRTAIMAHLGCVRPRPTPPHGPEAGSAA